MDRKMILVALTTLVVVGIVTLFPMTGTFVVAPIISLILGGVAGWLFTARSQEPVAAAGARGGLLAGAGALLGATIACVILLLMLGNDPSVQEAIRSSEPNPEARVPYAWFGLLSAVAGAITGLLVGALDLFLATIGGVVAGMIYGDSHPAHFRNTARR